VRLTFEDYALDAERRELTRGSEPIPIGPQVFDLLVYLLQNRTRVVSRDDLLKAVWRGRIVSESTLTSHINAVRKAIGDSGEQQRLIRTVARKGFRFVGQVREAPTPSEDPQTGRAPDYAEKWARPTPALALPSKPSIAVLPFQNLSGDPNQEYFADGIVEDITTGLARFRDLFVIARNSSFQYRGKPVDVRQVGRELGIRYLLEGSVRRCEDRVRISAQLIDAESGGHLWAEKYDHDCRDLFGLQDQVTESVVGAIQPEILRGESRRAARKNPTNLDAFDCCLRGIWHCHRRTAEDNQLAERWLRRSIELDGTLARSHVWLARLLFARCWHGTSRNINRDLQESYSATERALGLDDRDPECYYNLSILALMGHRHQQALSAAQRAIDLNPNFAFGFFALGETRIFMGEFAEALGPMAHCLRLSPGDPFAPIIISLVALAHYHLGNYDEAIRCSEQALRTARTYFVLRTTVATLGQLGRRGEVRSHLDEMGRIKPAEMERHWEITCPYADSVHEAKFAEGLLKAGYEMSSWR
jgi:adenylate cyclase